VINQTLEGYTSRFWKNIFRPKYIDLVQSVQSYRVYRYPTTSAKHFSFVVFSLFCVAIVISEQFFAEAYFRPDFAAIRREKFAAQYFSFKAKLKQKKFIFK